MLIYDGLELLDPLECEWLLGCGVIGRVGVTIAGLPVILPVNFAYLDGGIVFRTGEGTKLHAASNGAVIAFEVDDYDPRVHRGWSVLAIGRSRHVTDPLDRAALDARHLAPWAGRDRDHYVRLIPELLTGRRIAT